MKKVFVESTSICRNNLLESQWYKDFFVENSWELTEDVQSADFILLNTCSFHGVHERICFRRIEEIKRVKKADAKFVVCGCLPGMNPKGLMNVFDGVSFGPQEVHKLDELVNASKSISKVAFPNTFCAEERLKFVHLPPELSAKTIKIAVRALIRREYYWLYNLLFYVLFGTPTYILYGDHTIKVEDGCLGSCSYCSIPKARGTLRSRPSGEIKKELESLVKNGVRRIGLWGDDVGAYGLDDDSDVCSLLEELNEVEGDFDLMLYNFNPNWYSLYQTRLKKIISRGRIKAIHLPVQSGSDSVLRRMSRPYKATEIKKQILELRGKFSNLRLSTNIIVGFPGETEEEFNETMKFISEARFNEIVHLLSYSSQTDTSAASMPNQIPEKIKKNRADTLSKKLIIQLFKNKL